MAHQRILPGSNHVPTCQQLNGNGKRSDPLLNLSERKKEPQEYPLQYSQGSLFFDLYLCCFAWGKEAEMGLVVTIARFCLLFRQSSSFKSPSLIQPTFRQGRLMSQVRTPGRMKQISTRPIQSMPVMAFLAPSDTSFTQPV